MSTHLPSEQWFRAVVERTQEDAVKTYVWFSGAQRAERVASTQAQAAFELEMEEYEGPEQRALLRAFHARPEVICPLFGPDHVHNFVYVVREAVGVLVPGQIGAWYHDYPVVELLDGSGLAEHAEAYLADVEPGHTLL